MQFTSHLTLAEFKKLAEQYSRIAVFKEIIADRLTPIGIVMALQAEMHDGVILESGVQEHPDNRYSFIAFDAETQFKVQPNEVLEITANQKIIHDELPFAVLRKLLQKLACGSLPGVMKLVGGPIGFLTYDSAHYFENIPQRHQSLTDLPEMIFNFYRTTLVFDHHTQKLFISTITTTDGDLTEKYQAAQELLTQLIAKITQSSIENTEITAKNTYDFTTDMDDETFKKLILKAKNYIQQGDAFQIVLSRCFKKNYQFSPFTFYRALRKVSPMPYMFFLAVENTYIVGASPEKLVSVEDGEMMLTPIAGTRRKYSAADHDKNTRELLADEKEMAEHMMLVDLARNDIGAVCEPASVSVKELAQVKHYSHVSHITSVVTGKLKSCFDALHALAAAFPAGTLSGAPKIRAMEIIDELEISKRGLYGGAICRLDYQGNLDSCIAIRMAILKEGIATIRTGAGIVHDSNPDAEVAETLHKARALLEALSLAEQGL